MDPLLAAAIAAADATLARSRVRRATVHNKAQLAYDALSSWIEGEGALPSAHTSATPPSRLAGMPPKNMGP